MASKIYLSFLTWNSLIIMSVYLTPNSAPSLCLFWKSLPPLLWNSFLSSVWPPQRSSKPHRCYPLWEARSWKFKTFDILASFAASFQSRTLASWIRHVPRILSPGLERQGQGTPKLLGPLGVPAVACARPPWQQHSHLPRSDLGPSFLALELGSWVLLDFVSNPISLF